MNAQTSVEQGDNEDSARGIGRFNTRTEKVCADEKLHSRLIITPR